MCCNLECIQVHISEARVSTALDKLAYMETLVTDKILQDRNATGSDLLLPTPSTSSTPSLAPAKSRQPKRSINVSGPIQPYNDHLKNFWYPVAFSAGLKDDTMVNLFPKTLFSLNVPLNFLPPHSFSLLFVVYPSFRCQLIALRNLGFFSAERMANRGVFRIRVLTGPARSI